MKKNVKKRKNNKKERKESPILVGIVLILMGLLSLFSLFSNKMGLFGTLTYKLLTLLTGSGNFLIPIILVVSGILFLFPQYKKETIKYTLLLSLISLCLLIYLDGTKNGDLTLVDRIALSTEYMDIATSGGIIGSIFGFFMYKFFGSIGTYMILATVIFICVFAIFKINIDKMKSIKDSFTDITDNSTKKVFSIFNRKSEDNIVENQKNKNQVSKIKESKVEKIEDNNEAEQTEENIVIRDFSNKNENTSRDTLKNPVIINENSKKTQSNKEVSNKIDDPYTSTIEVKQTLTDLPQQKYIFPPEELLNYNKTSTGDSKNQIMQNAKIIEQTMDTFGISSKVVAINKGPVVTLYELEPDPGVKLSKIVSLSDNLSMALASADIRIEAPIPGKAAVGIEVPNKNKDSVFIRDLITSAEFRKLASDLPLALGKDVSGEIVVSSIEKMPHLLIAGATGSGKSVCINTIITSILFKSSPDDVKLLLIDPKIVELSIYNDIPHLLIPVVTDPKKAAFALNWAVGEMERRYELFASLGVKDLISFNKKVDILNEPKLPKIVIVVDELADLMMVSQKEVEDYIARLAQKARASGIYLIIATQRPSVDVITGTIKANVPSRIAFSVSSQIDSRTILDMAGAEKLLGKGDMLFYPGFYSKPIRVQGAFITDEEVERVVEFVKANNNVNKDLEEKITKEIQQKKEVSSTNDMDELFIPAIKYVLDDEQASISFLQRKLKIGYSRAARIVDQLEEHGIIGPHEGSKPRKLLMTKEEIEDMLGESFE